MIAPERRAEIERELARLEREQGVRALLAVESGSRAWGFPSADSDYDVRMIYAHPRDWYLSVREQRDVIELPISGDLDIAGWDLRKALRLLQGGNAVVHEWLGSPIVYQHDAAALDVLRTVAAAQFNARPVFHHYLAMSRKKLSPEPGEAVTAKRFLYGLRTLLCAGWVHDDHAAPPMRVVELLDRYVPQGSSWRQDIDRLIALKALGSEKDTETNFTALMAWARGELDELCTSEAPEVRLERDDEQLDVAFRGLLG